MSEALFDGSRSKQRLLLLLTFIYRAVMLPGDLFQEVEETVDLDELLAIFLEQWEEELTILNCTFNYHAFSHVLQVRRALGPLFAVSTERYECLYGSCKRNYVYVCLKFCCKTSVVQCVLLSFLQCGHNQHGQAGP